MTKLQGYPLSQSTCARTVTLLAGTILSVSSTTAWAQQPTAPPPADTKAADAPASPDIIVTAQRRSESILTVPYNISAVTGDEIEARGIVDAPELLRTVPGVSTVDRGYRNSSVFNGVFIRGLNVDGASLGDYAVSAASTVSTYVDDTPIFANFLLNDIERVEILRGPQGTLYGSGSLGGTVRYIMREPHFNGVEGRVATTLSTTKGSGGLSWRTDGAINLPLGQNAAIRLSGAVVHSAGITDYVNLYVLDSAGIPVAPNGILDPAAQYYRKKDADDAKIWFGRASLLWEPSAALKFKASYMHQSDDVGGRRQQTPGVDGYGRRYRDYENGSVQLEPSSRDVDLGALEATLDLGFATLTSSSSYFDHRGTSNSENTGFYAKAGFLGYYLNYPRPLASAVRPYSDKAFVQELRIVSKAGRRFDYVAGVFYQDEKLASDQTSYLRGFKRYADLFFGDPTIVTGDVDFEYRRRENFRQLAGFGELTWHLTDAFQVTGGARWFDNRSKNDTFIALPLYAGLAPPTEATFKSKENDVIFKVNASWDFARNGLLYATISEGFRRGGSNAVPLTGFFKEDPGWQIYEPDTVVNYELGVKGRAGMFRYNAAAFYVDWNNVQLNTQTTNWGFFAVQNGKSARTQGVELELQANLTRKFNVGLGYTYVDAKLTSDFFSPTATPRLIARRGARLPATPKHSLNASASYSTPIGANMEWNARINWSYRSSARNAIGLSPRFNVGLAPFHIVDVSTGLTRGQLGATIFARNLFNAKGITGVFTEAYMGTAPEIGYFGNGAKELIAQPRTIGATLNYRF